MPRALPILLLLLPLCALAQQTHVGKVVRIADGDTLSILVDGQTRKIRLAEIDTPERQQPFGTKAKQALSDLTFNKIVRVVEVDVDHYGRIVGRVCVNGWTSMQNS